jgi:dCTP deaminase
MELLHKAEIKRRLSLDNDYALRIDPLLDENQIGEVTIDLRLGADFLVSVHTRRAYVSLIKDEEQYRGVSSFFQATRRELGDRFVLYPHQLVLATSLEYIALPPDVYTDVLTRSSYNRLGVHLASMIQPGFRGCVPLELFNHGNNAVELVVGSRLIQTRLFKTEMDAAYRNEDGRRRKYYGDVRPKPSRAADDPDLAILENVRERR